MKHTQTHTYIYTYCMIPYIYNETHTYTNTYIYRYTSKYSHNKDKTYKTKENIAGKYGHKGAKLKTGWHSYLRHTHSPTYKLKTRGFTARYANASSDQRKAQIK